MKSKINFLLFPILIISLVFGVDGNFQGWGNIILHHVTDSEKLKIYNIPISKHVIMLLVSAFVTAMMAIWATKNYRKDVNAKPAGLSHLYEILLEFIDKDIVTPYIGKTNSNIWTPLAMTFFVFILTCNLLGLIPFFEFIEFGGGGGSTVTGNFSVTVAFAIITFFAIIIAGVKRHGFIGHWKNMVPSGIPAPVLIILIPIEIIGMFVKPFALTMRLGANMTAGHIGMLSIFALPIILGNGIQDPSHLNYTIGFLAGFLAVIINTGIYALEIIISLVQAYVFTLLSCVFIGMAIHPNH